MSLSLAAIASYLDSYLGSARFPNDQSGIYHASTCAIRRIGLAIEPWTEIGAWVRQERLDALFLHRPWHLNIQELPDDVGVLAYHLAFDLTLTFGFNRRLADALQMAYLFPFAFKDAVPLGMIGNISPTALDTFVECLAETFGVSPVLEKKYTDTVSRIAVVGAMTDTLIRDAAAQEVQLYVTGQFRQPARGAVQETGMAVAVIGHSVGEWWGLRALAGLLRERWAHLDVVVAPQELN